MKNSKVKTIFTNSLICILTAVVMTVIQIAAPLISGSSSIGAFNADNVYAKESEDVITLKICNWEEYIDEGGWDEPVELDNKTITSDKSMVDGFKDWYYQTYHKRVNVEYSCLGTNEELYNMLTLGDEYDLICPSEYMIMKLMAQGWLEPFSEEFYDTSNPYNYYAKGVSPFIKNVFDTNKINGESWSRYAAGYMWGVTGIVYNPENVSEQEASTWKIINNDKFKRQITVKDNVRDSMFAAVGAIKSDKLMSDTFKNASDYKERLAKEMNDTSDTTVDDVRTYLQQVKDNVYSFETDSAKADMVTGKVSAGYQWSGDAVYTMNQADDDGVSLDFAVPYECTNMYFDGWTMLKSGINGNEEKKQAAEGFINFISMPDNAVRNMEYIGYTSAISGGDDTTVYEYVKYNYEAENETDTVTYPLGYFFSGDSADERYMLVTTKEQTKRQLSAQYPSEDVMERSAIMQYFNDEDNSRINQMWISVRCYNIHNIPVWGWIIAIVVIAGGIMLYVKNFIKNKKQV